jgi:hypothetical protein
MFRDNENLIRLYESVYENNTAWDDLMNDIREQEEEGDFDLVDYIWNIREYDLYDLVPQIYSDYFGNPAEYDGVVYHSTPEENLESIENHGLRPESRTRGISNRNVGSAIFTSYEPDEMGSYGDGLVAIDLEIARRMNPKLETGLEPPIEEYIRRSAIANRLGIEDTGMFLPSQSDGIREDTLIIYGDVPKEAIEIIIH